MKVLAIEYSSAQRSIAIAQESGAGQPASLVEVVESGGRAANTFAMIEEALQQAGLERDQIDCIAVGIGPGSYTGIRAAISTAQGWQLATGVKLLAIGSAEAIAAEAVENGMTGRFTVVIDAQRGEFYVAGFEAVRNHAELREHLRIVTRQELLDLAKQSGAMIGPEPPAGVDGFKQVLPRAAVVARLALTRTDFVPGESITPIYLRETTFVKSPPSRTA